jgi:hypothetical protein
MRVAPAHTIRPQSVVREPKIPAAMSFTEANNALRALFTSNPDHRTMIGNGNISELLDQRLKLKRVATPVEGQFVTSRANVLHGTGTVYDAHLTRAADGEWIIDCLIDPPKNVTLATGPNGPRCSFRWCQLPPLDSGLPETAPSFHSELAVQRSRLIDAVRQLSPDSGASTPWMPCNTLVRGGPGTTNPYWPNFADLEVKVPLKGIQLGINLGDDIQCQVVRESGGALILRFKGSQYFAIPQLSPDEPTKVVSVPKSGQLVYYPPPTTKLAKIRERLRDTSAKGPLLKTSEYQALRYFEAMHSLAVGEVVTLRDVGRLASQNGYASEVTIDPLGKKVEGRSIYFQVGRLKKIAGHVDGICSQIVLTRVSDAAWESVFTLQSAAGPAQTILKWSISDGVLSHSVTSLERGRKLSNGRHLRFDGLARAIAAEALSLVFESKFGHRPAPIGPIKDAFGYRYALPSAFRCDGTLFVVVAETPLKDVDLLFTAMRYARSHLVDKMTFVPLLKPDQERFETSRFALLAAKVGRLKKNRLTISVCSLSEMAKEAKTEDARTTLGEFARRIESRFRDGDLANLAKIANDLKVGPGPGIPRNGAGISMRSPTVWKEKLAEFAQNGSAVLEAFHEFDRTFFKFAPPGWHRRAIAAASYLLSKMDVEGSLYEGCLRILRTRYPGIQRYEAPWKSILEYERLRAKKRSEHGAGDESRGEEGSSGVSQRPGGGIRVFNLHSQMRFIQARIASTRGAHSDGKSRSKPREDRSARGPDPEPRRVSSVVRCDEKLGLLECLHDVAAQLLKPAAERRDWLESQIVEFTIRKMLEGRVLEVSEGDQLRQQFATARTQLPLDGLIRLLPEFLAFYKFKSLDAAESVPLEVGLIALQRISTLLSGAVRLRTELGLVPALERIVADLENRRKPRMIWLEADIVRAVSEPILSGKDRSDLVFDKALMAIHENVTGPTPTIAALVSGIEMMLNKTVEFGGVSYDYTQIRALLKPIGEILR